MQSPPVLPGEKDLVYSYRFASEDGQTVFLSLVKKVLKAEEKEVCFAQIRQEHLRLSEKGGVKLKGVLVLENLSPEELKAGLCRNFAQVAAIGEDLFDGKPPPEIAHLINLLRTDYDAREMYAIHAGLAPMSSYAAIFKEVHDFLMYKIPKRVLRLILKTLSHVPNWRNVVRSSLILQVTLDHRDCENYRVPYNRPNQTELYREQHEALFELGIYEYEVHQQQLLSDEQLVMINALRLLDYLRNRYAHRMQPINDSQCMELSPNFAADFTAESSELSTRVRFPLIVLEVQDILQKHGMLGQLKLKNFF